MPPSGTPSDSTSSAAGRMPRAAVCGRVLNFLKLGLASSGCFLIVSPRDADMAQLVEHHLARGSRVQIPLSAPLSSEGRSGSCLTGLCNDSRQEWRSGQVVRQRPATFTPVRIWASPPTWNLYADMAQLVEHNLAKAGVAGSNPLSAPMISESRACGLSIFLYEGFCQTACCRAQCQRGFIPER